MNDRYIPDMKRRKDKLEKYDNNHSCMKTERRRGVANTSVAAMGNRSTMKECKQRMLSKAEIWKLLP